MARAPKICGHTGCIELTTATYCTEHEALDQKRMARRRGRTATRGYGSKHQRERKRWTRLIAQGDVTCWRCLELIDPDEPWDLGHDDFDRSITRGPEHANRCNRPTSGRRAAKPPPRGGSD